MTVALLVGVMISACIGVDDPWVAVLKEGQLANQAKVVEGRADIQLDWDREGKPPIHMQGSLAWNKQNYSIEWISQDAEGFLSGQATDAAKVAPVREFLLNTSDRSYYYNTLLDRVAIRKDWSNTLASRNLDYRPAVTWFSSNPPSGTRSWIEMMDLRITSPDGRKSDLTFTPSKDGRLVHQVRADPDGGRLEVTYSIEDACNPVNSVYTKPNGEESSHANYQWIHLRDIVVLSSLDKEQTIEHPETKKPYRTIYKLRFSDFHPDAGPRSRFTKEDFLKHGGNETMVEDMVTNKKSKNLKRDLKGDLDKLIQDLKTSKFLDR